MSKNNETITIPKDKWDSICRRIKRQDSTIAEQSRQLNEMSVILNAALETIAETEDAKEKIESDVYIKQMLFSDRLIVIFSDKTAAILPISGNNKNALRADLLTAFLVHSLGGYNEIVKSILQQVDKLADTYSGF